MYSQQDLQDISRQLRTRILVWAIPEALLIAGIILSIIRRVELLTMLLVILFSFIAIFSWGLYLSPVRKYMKFLDSALNGRNRSLQGHFRFFEQEKAVRDGVQFVPFYVNIGEGSEEEDDRLLYYDSNLPTPDWRTGEKLLVVSQDKAVISWQRL